MNIKFIALHSQAIKALLLWLQYDIQYNDNREVFQSYLYESRAHPNTNKVIPTDASKARPTIAVNREDQRNENASILELWHTCFLSLHQKWWKDLSYRLVVFIYQKLCNNRWLSQLFLTNSCISATEGALWNFHEKNKSRPNKPKCSADPNWVRSVAPLSNFKPPQYQSTI